MRATWRSRDVATERPGTQVPEDEFVDEARLLPGVRLIGSGTIADRTMSMPAINVLAFEAPCVVDAANQIVPTARAVIGLRLAPGDDGERATRILADHLSAAAPWGVHVSVEPGEPGAGYMVDTSSAACAWRSAMAEAFGADVVEMGRRLHPARAHARRDLPDLQVLIWGQGDHLSNYHSTDESACSHFATHGPHRDALHPEPGGRAGSGR